MAASDVGSRELKTRLGAYLRRVRDGQTFIVTDRGEAVAELRPIGRGTSTAERLTRLTVKGTVTRQRSGSVSAFKPARVQKGVSASRAVTKVREDRF